MIDTAPLFAPLHEQLLELLRSLTPDDWLRPTVAGTWRVRDVAAHLLDGDLRKVAAYRDHHLAPGDGPVSSPADAARLVNGLNASGVHYAQRLSPRLLIDLLAVTGPWVSDLVTQLPPQAPARFPVSWAGESTSANWMDTGREYTERWHHQMQIRDAVGHPLLLSPHWLHPLLGISVHALRAAYADVTATAGTTVVLAVDADPASTWTVRRAASGWAISAGAAPAPTTTVTMTGDTAWRLFYNALPAAELAARVEVTGQAALAAPLLNARSVIL